MVEKSPKTWAEMKAEIAKEDADHKKMLIGVVPALPGWNRIDIFSDSEDTYLTPIIAWEMLTYGGKTVAHPVCFEDADHGNTWAIKSPDGPVFRPEDCSWDNEDGYVTSMINRRKKLPK